MSNVKSLIKGEFHAFLDAIKSVAKLLTKGCRFLTSNKSSDNDNTSYVCNHE